MLGDDDDGWLLAGHSRAVHMLVLFEPWGLLSGTQMASDGSVDDGPQLRSVVAHASDGGEDDRLSVEGDILQGLVEGWVAYDGVPADVDDDESVWVWVGMIRRSELERNFCFLHAFLAV